MPLYFQKEYQNSKPLASKECFVDWGRVWYTWRTMFRIFPKRKWDVLGSTYKLKTPYWQVRRDRCKTLRGHKVDYYVIERQDAAAIVAFTAKHKVVLVRQYRHPIKEWVLEAPAGLIEQGENPKKAAQRELAEETGYAVDALKLMGRFYLAPGIIDQRWNLYIGFNAKRVGGENRDPGEDMEVVVMNFDRALQMVTRGSLQEIDTVLALLYAKDYVRKHGLL